MSTPQTAKTQYLPSTTHPSTTYAYRLLGPAFSPTTTPLLYLNHFRSTLDKADPLLLSLLSRSRPLIIVDYAGHGHSTGEPATSAAASAAYIEDFLALLGVRSLFVLGFSMGGMVAQMLALNASSVDVKKLVIAGSTASIGEKIVRAKAEQREEVGRVAGAVVPDMETFQTLFFHRDGEGTKACAEWWERVHERTARTAGEEVGGWVSEGFWDGAKGLKAQVQVLEKWMEVETAKGREGSYERLAGLRIPVLVANGGDDFMVPTINSFFTAQQISDAKLVVYPNSGHGFLFQYAEEVAAEVDRFLA
ncbi:alpha/beta-hydrolase [Polyplosphaeria fusca]|uniref:Alpha/beta-hydrolase n=1 Tax=Polyplosphaeria fusca TaxID=682080 RepID=A0A9P4R7R3_9PLEO|nr:alpha/beta-hydrolase [Polyplosphaeria fusca]